MQIKLEHTESSSNSESIVSLTRLSPINITTNQDSEGCYNTCISTTVQDQLYSTENTINATLTGLSPLCQIQFGQRCSGCVLPKQCSTPILSDSLKQVPISHYEEVARPKVSLGNSPNLTNHSRNISMSLLTNTTTWSPHSQINPKCYGSVSSPSGFISTPASGTSIPLNSSGEEIENISPDYPRAPQNTPVNCEVTRISAPNLHISQVIRSLDNEQYLSFSGRENHNEKERKRRNRIKNACQTLRNLVPGMSNKTDKATVFEFTVEYLIHLKKYVGSKYDKDFLEKCSPY
ncbi:uncharacterized protein [Centruroides vittatus]|uniref:uncharacterized protein n=1 Tax=Centruroides vittatus TaxID=120091 RepID=UPI00350EF857